MPVPSSPPAAPGEPASGVPPRPPGSRVLRNVVAGAAGRIVIAGVSLLCIPIVIRLLGVERYGVAALSATFLSLAAILDLGVAPTFNRELARLSILAGEAETMRDLLRTFEWVVWSFAALIALAGLAAAPFVPGWFRAGEIPPHELVAAAALIAVSVAVQFPTSLYSGGLIGLQEQVEFNAVVAAAVTLRSCGGVAVLWLVSPTLDVYLGWQILTQGAQTLVLAVLLRRRLPAALRRPRLRPALLRRLWRLALGMSGTSVLAILAGQADKIALSRVLPLETFGCYMIAWSIASRLGLLSDPVADSVFPHLTEVAALEGAAAVEPAYRSGAQLMALALVPAALVIVFFAPDVGAVWTLGASSAGLVARLLTPLMLGALFASLLDVPMVMQWAVGRARPMFLAKLASALLATPAVVLIAVFWGVVPAAWAQPAVNGAVLAATLPVLHRLVFGRGQAWWWRDLAVAAAAISAALLLWRIFGPEASTFVGRLARIFVAAVLAASAGALALPAGRRMLRAIASLAAPRARRPAPRAERS